MVFPENSKSIVEAENSDLCPICGSTGSAYLHNCRDYICGLTGAWVYNQCHQCKSLWLVPPPSREMIATFYPPHYYTHSAATQPLEEPKRFFARMRYTAKLASLQNNYGYAGVTTPLSPSTKIVSKLLSLLPTTTKRAGYMVRFLSYRHHSRLLEVGAGNGDYMRLMQQLGWQVEGIEPDPKAAQIAIASGLNVVLSTAEEAVIEPESYDAIVLHHVTEHLLKPKDVFQKLVYGLKPGGILVSISPNPVGIIANYFGNQWYELDPPRHLVLPSPKGYKLMFDDLPVKTEVSTTMQIAFWILRESMSITQTGTTGKCKNEWIPKVASIVGGLLSSVFPTKGEEVICIVHKQK